MDCFDEGAGQPLDDGSLTLDIAASRGEGARRRKDLQLDSAGEKPPPDRSTVSAGRPASARALRVKVSASEPYCETPIIAPFNSSPRRTFELRPTMSFWLERLAAAPRIATSAPRTRARVNAVTPAKATSTSPAISDWTSRGLPVMRRISAAKSCLA